MTMEGQLAMDVDASTAAPAAVRDAALIDPKAVAKARILATEMEFYLIDVNADIARDWKLFNKTPKTGETATNRRPSKASQNNYKREMRSGEWFINPQPIVFSEPDDNGEIMLVDGQTRLDSLIDMDKEFPGFSLPFVVCFNAPRNSMAVIDRLRRRMPADMLAMAGEAYSAKLSHALRMLYSVLNQRPFVSTSEWRRLVLSPTAQAAFLQEHGSLRQGLQMTMKAKSQIQPHVGAVVWYLIQQEHGVFVAEEFMEGLLSGANLELFDPRLKLRQYFAQMKGRKYKWDGFEQLAFVITAANAWFLRDEDYLPAKAWDVRAPKRFPELIRKAQIPDRLMTGI